MADIGSVLEGKYEILKLIGKGGMSRVYLAMDKRLNKTWAVKEIEKNARDENNEIVVQSAMAEAHLIERLDHPALPRIVDILEYDKVIYVVMDYIDGEPLSKVLEEHGAQPQDLVIEWAKQICDVLDYLHTQTPPIIYRDMKPGNLMLKLDGNIKVIDFGIAREYKQKNLADTVCLGTKGYAAPEQFGGRGQTDARTDIYCLGATLYHLITGHNPCDPPFQMYPIRHWNPALSGGLERIILKCTQLNPEDRYQSCAELLYALDHYEEEDEVYRAEEKKQLKTFIGMASATVACMLVGVLGLVMNTVTINGNYDTMVKDNTVPQYQAAIALKPGELAEYDRNTLSATAEDAYNGLITYYERNGFGPEESKILQSCFSQSNLAKIENNPNFGALMYRVGMLYMFNYKEGNGTDSAAYNATLATNWFRRAIDAAEGAPENADYYNMAQVYWQIGTFYQTLESSINKGEDAGKYVAHWNDIQNMLTLLEQDTSKTEFMELSVYKVAVYSMEKYARKFASDKGEDGISVSYAEMADTLANIENRVAAVDATSEETTIPMKKAIEERFDDVQRNINLAYGKDGGER